MVSTDSSLSAPNRFMQSVLYTAPRLVLKTGLIAAMLIVESRLSHSPLHFNTILFLFAERLDSTLSIPLTLTGDTQHSDIGRSPALGRLTERNSGVGRSESPATLATAAVRAVAETLRGALRRVPEETKW